MNSKHPHNKQQFWQQVNTLWEDTLGSPEVTIAILDGPVDTSHPTLKSANLKALHGIQHQNGAAAQHGTHVASIIFGQHTSNLKGVTPNCRGLLLPIFSEKADGSLQASNQLDLARSLQYVLQDYEDNGGKYIVNISAGELSQDGEASPRLQKVLDDCHQKGILIVSAAGNNGCACLHIPAASPNTLAVGALDEEGQPANFSNWGKAYQRNGLMAPGENILGAMAGSDSLVARNGTSFATPLVSGVIALLLSKYDSLSPLTVKDVLLETSNPCPQVAVNEGASCAHYLHGIINIEAAVVRLDQMTNAAITRQDNNSHQNLSFVQHLNLNLMNDLPQEVSTSEAVVESSEVVASEVSTAETSTVVPQEEVVVLPSAQVTPSEVTPQVQPSHIEPSCGCSNTEGQQLVFALGSLGVDFGTDAVLDSFKFYMTGLQDKSGKKIEYPNPSDPEQLLTYLESHPYEASRVIWTLNQESTPIYAIHPSSNFEVEAYVRLRNFLTPILDDDTGDAKTKPFHIDMASIPGHIIGQVRLLSGQVIPQIAPNLRAMYNWRTDDLVKVVLEMIEENQQEECA